MKFTGAALAMAVLVTTTVVATPSLPAVAGHNFAVSAVLPCVGPTAGGTTVTITGSGFFGHDGSVGGDDDVTNVAFAPDPNDVSFAPSFTVMSDTQLTAVTPARFPGLVSVAVFQGENFVFKFNAFVYDDDPNATCANPGGDVGVPYFDFSPVFSEACPVVGGWVEFTGQNLDELEDDDTWGLWIRQGGPPGVNTSLAPGLTELKASVSASEGSRSADKIRFELPDLESLPGWHPGDVVDLIVRNGRGQVSWGGVNWHRPGRCWEFDADPSTNVSNGFWSACDGEQTTGCYELTDTNGSALTEDLAALVLGYNTSDKSNWNLLFRVVPADKLQDAKDACWRDWVQNEERPLDWPVSTDPNSSCRFGETGQYDLDGLLPGDNKVRLTLRTGDLGPPVGWTLRAMVDPATGVVLDSTGGASTISMVLSPAVVTYPSIAGLDICTLDVGPGNWIAFTPVFCGDNNMRGGSTRVTMNGLFGRTSYWHPDNGMGMTTSAPLVGGHRLVRNEDGTPLLQIAVGAPHLTEDGGLNSGFVQAFITDWQVANLGLDTSMTAAALASQLQITRDDDLAANLTATFTKLTGGFLVTITDLHFSAPVLTARTAPATANSYTMVDPRGCGNERLVVNGSGFTTSSGASRVEAVTFRRSSVEQVSAEFDIVKGKVAVTVPSSQRQGNVTVRLFGQFGETGTLGYRFVNPPETEPGRRQVSLDWAGSDWDLDNITDYVIQSSRNCGPWLTVRDGVTTATNHTVSGLSNGVSYRFRIAAVSNGTRSLWSAPATQTPS
jgi:hypothetical protein